MIYYLKFLIVLIKQNIRSFFFFKYFILGTSVIEKILNSKQVNKNEVLKTMQKLALGKM